MNGSSVKNPEYVKRTNLVPGKDNEFSLGPGESDSQVVVGNLGLGKRTKVEFQERSRVQRGHHHPVKKVEFLGMDEIGKPGVGGKEKRLYIQEKHVHEKREKKEN